MINLKKKYKIIILLIAIILFVLVVCKIYFNVDTNDYIKRKINIDISKCNIKVDNDDHGGFLGDGDYFIKADCSNNYERMIEQTSSWKDLPLSKNIHLAMYGGIKEGTWYSYEFANDVGIPAVTNGKYLFIDRYSDAIDTHSDADLFNRASFNFTIAIYDKDTNYFYYYELDT